MDDLLGEFLTECAESLDQLDIELVKLEQDPNDPDLLGSIFRLVHTIKGTCGFLGLPRLEAVAHAGENILGKFRDRDLKVDALGVTLILEALDKIKEILAVIEQTEAEPEGNDQDLIDRLNRHASGANVSESAPEQPASAAPVAEAAPVEEMPAPEADEFGFVPVPAAQTGQVAAQITAAPEPAQAEPEASSPAAAESPAPAAAPEPKKTATPAAPTASEKAEISNESGTKERSVANQSIRVSVELLENLMTTVSELVLTRNQLLQMLRGVTDSEFMAPLQRLSHITTELQEDVMKTRMQPIGNAWSKLPRIVRDLAQELNKKMDLKMIGADTELDRQVLELIRDPLTHMVRNSADHGLEIPADRVAAGKPETGAITLHAYHEGGHIIIKIADDGAGIKVAKVRAKVIEKGLASEAELDGMSDEQIQHYVFDAGFSTADAVTSVSGRGVGMDVVRTNIEKIGGTVEMKSTEGKGSTFTIKIPLTLAIVSALVIEAGGERFCMPQISVVELVRASKTSEHRIETIKDTPVLRLRDRLLPLISLNHALKLDGAKEFDVAAENFIIVVQVGAQNFGVIVDRVFDTEEIVVKPVAPILRDIALFSGNTILGDGSVVMILDPNGMAALVGSAANEHAAGDEATLQTSADMERTSLLLFEAGGNEPKAVPLGLVSRLEEIDMTDVETSGDRPVIQYRGELMPLVIVDGAAELSGEGKRAVLVFADGSRKMGVVVDQILDIVEERLNIELASTRPGYIGGAVLNGRSTDVIDIGYYATQAYNDWFRVEGDVAYSNGGGKTSVLIVDDSAFFRNLLVPMLSVGGYAVTTAESAAEALELREDGRKFDLIVSDIDMPGMNGFDFATECRVDSRWQKTPMVALSSHTAAEDFERGRAVGFNDYVAKSDRDTLMSSLQNVLATAGENA